MKFYIQADTEYDPDEVFPCDEDARADYARYTKSPELIEIYAFDPDDHVRCRVAENPNITEELLRMLAQDSSWHTKCGVAWNPKTPSDILEMLSHDFDTDVRMNVAGNINAPVEVLQRLSKDPDILVREAVAENTATPSFMLTDMYDNDIDLNVRYTAYANLVHRGDI